VTHDPNAPPAPPSFPALDSTTPDFWNVRYQANFTPWDAGGVPPEVAALAAGSTPRGRVLVPGCGSGWELAEFLRTGWDALAIDFSAAAVERAHSLMPAHRDRIVLADFFEFDSGDGFDLVYERTFLCALKPVLWSRWSTRIAAVIRPGGLLAGYFYRQEKIGGPPFALPEGGLEEMLGGRFERIAQSPSIAPIDLFRGHEQWEIWRRR